MWPAPLCGWGVGHASLPMALPLYSRIAARAFEEAYCKAVRTRTGWSYRRISDRMRSWIQPAVSTMMGCSANPADFVRAGFRSLSHDFCQRTWRRPYPPLHVFATDGAQARWWRYTEGKHKSQPNRELAGARIRKIVGRSQRVFEAMDPAMFALAMTSGDLSPWWIAARRCRYGEDFVDVPDSLGVDECIDVLRELDPKDQQRIWRLL